jgi:hypothetical protein
VMIGAIGAPANGGGGANDARTMRRVSLRRGRRAIGGGVERARRRARDRAIGRGGMGTFGARRARGISKTTTTRD